MPDHPGVETVVVDLDDTLVLSARAYAAAVRALRDLGVPSDRFVAAHRRWWGAYQAGRCSMEQLHERRMADCGLTGVAAHEATERFVSAAAAVSWRPGARQLLGDLRDLGVRTVVLTNGGARDQRRKVRHLGLDGQVDAVVVSDEVGHAKPAAAAFRAALAAVGGDPASAAMVGDDLDVDVRAALGAGLARAVWVTQRPGPAGDRRIAKVRSLGCVLAALRRPVDVRSGSRGAAT